MSPPLFEEVSNGMKETLFDIIFVNILLLDLFSYSTSYFWSFVMSTIFIGPESDHWECLSLTHSLTHSCLVNLIDVTLACEDAYSKLVEVVTVADVYDEDHVGNSLLQIWKLRFGHKAKLLLRLGAQGLVKILKLKFRQIFKLEFGQYFAADVTQRLRSLILI